MSFEPAVAPAGVCNERNTQGEGFLHFLDDDGFYLLPFVRIDAEVEFIMYLKDHPRFQAFGF